MIAVLIGHLFLGVTKQDVEFDHQMTDLFVFFSYD